MQGIGRGKGGRVYIHESEKGRGDGPSSPLLIANAFHANSVRKSIASLCEYTMALESTFLTPAASSSKCSGGKCSTPRSNCGNVGVQVGVGKGGKQECEARV